MTGIYASLQSALHCIDDGQVVVISNHSIGDDEIHRILRHPRVRGAVVGGGRATTPGKFDGRLGLSDGNDGAWSFPNVMARTVVLLDRPDNLRPRQVYGAMRRGVRTIVVRKGVADLGWEPHSAAGLFLRCVRNAARYRLGALASPAWLPKHLRLSEGRYEQRIRRMLNVANPPLLPSHAFVPRRIVLVNPSLAAGGAERQVLNTALGLHKRGFGDLSILCDYLTPGSLDFHLREAKEGGVAVSERGRMLSCELARAIQPHAQRLRTILNGLPSDFAGDIFEFAAEFLLRRPSVLHAWQDQTSVKAGLAAAIVGVPRIILGGRSVSPRNFLFYQPYLRGGYMALSRHPGVRLVNNSLAGAADYAEWLGIPPGRICIVHNGYDFARFCRKDAAAIAAYKERLGISPERRIVGTIIRLSEEKRPLLWIKVAEALSRRADLAFVMIGKGPLRDDILAAIERAGLRGRFVLPGIEPDAALALSAFDVFLLTSRKEGLPNVLVEAQAVGTPVVATDAGGAAETFEDGVTGRLVRSSDPEEIASAVLSTLTDESWRRRAIAAAPVFVTDRFSLERMTSETISLYGYAG